MAGSRLRPVAFERGRRADGVADQQQHRDHQRDPELGGGALRRYSSVGDLEEEIQLPVSSPTCPTFGGPDLGTLYVTTAKHRLSRHQLLSEPLAGAVLALEPGVRGLPVNEFGG